MNANQLSAELRCSDDGLWRAQCRTAVSYPESGNADCFGLEDRSFWFQHRNDCIAAVVRRHPPSGVILDIGGGNGFVTRRLLDEGYETLLLEPGLDGARNARDRRHIPQVICASFEDACLRPAAVPAIGMFDVIEHVAGDRQFLEQIHSVLLPGGLLYLSVPMHPWLWSAADVWAGHCRRYRYAELMTLLGGGFEVLFRSYFFAPLILPIALLRALPYRCRFGRTQTPLAAEVEHGLDEGVASRALRWLLRREVAALGAGRTLRHGASMLIVARKRA